jgi:signal transduction histidine kinase
MNLKCRFYQLVSVSDTRIGIKAEATKTIFDAFQQEDNSTSRKYGGTGLDLPLCKQLLELHQGGIWVESRPGEGSTFPFVLPITEGADEQNSTHYGPH